MGDLSLKGGRKDPNKRRESWSSDDGSWFASHSSVFGPYRQRSVLQDLCHRKTVDELIFQSNARSRSSSITTPYVVSSHFNQGISIWYWFNNYVGFQLPEYLQGQSANPSITSTPWRSRVSKKPPRRRDKPAGGLIDVLFRYLSASQVSQTKIRHYWQGFP